MGVLEERARARTPASLREQWRQDRFVQPCAVDQRALLELDGHLFAAAADFEAIELSPVAPLGVCAAVALASQNKIVSTARGTEVVSDPTNVLALECARRLVERSGGRGAQAGTGALAGAVAQADAGALAGAGAQADRGAQARTDGGTRAGSGARAGTNPALRAGVASDAATPFVTAAPVRLATSHRCTRAQAVPKRPGFAAHFRMFCLATAGHERENRELTSSALAEHINTHLGALERLRRNGYSVLVRGVRILSTDRNAELARRVAAGVRGAGSGGGTASGAAAAAIAAGAATGAAGAAARIEHQVLEHPYYDGIRFMIDIQAPDGSTLPLIDGGAFNWLRKLTSNNKLVYVASGMGSQILAMLFRR